MTAKKTNIITLICNKGGVGRSTTAINYAWSLAIKDKKVLVCDLDAQANASSTLALDYGTDVVDRGRNMTNLLKSSGEGALDFIVDTRNENIKLLASTLVLDSTEGEVKSFLDLNIFKLFDHMFNNKLKEEFDYVICDTPPWNLFVDAKIVSKYFENHLFIVCNQETSFKDIDSFVNDFEDTKSLLYIFNKFHLYLNFLWYQYQYPNYSNNYYYDYHSYSGLKNEFTLRRFLVELPTKLKNKVFKWVESLRERLAK